MRRPVLLRSRSRRRRLQSPSPQPRHRWQLLPASPQILTPIATSFPSSTRPKTTSTRPSRTCLRRQATSSLRLSTAYLTGTEAQALLDLVDWRRRVGDLYRIHSPDAIVRFREQRDELFRSHPQSPIEPDERASFEGLRYFPHDPAFRVQAHFEPADGSELLIDTGGDDGAVRYRRAGHLDFQLNDQPCRLTVLSLVQYAGGLFVPFRHTTSRDVWRWTLPLGHGEGHGRARARDHARLTRRHDRFQLRVQRVLRVQPTLGVSACAAGKFLDRSGQSRRAQLQALGGRSDVVHGLDQLAREGDRLV